MTGSSPLSPTVSESLARWAAALAYDGLPAEVARMARRCLLDTLGCALQGSTTPEAKLLVAVREDLGGSGPCTVWGRPGSAPASVAALLNGTHAHLRELDDVGCGGHASACQVPAAMAAAEVAGADGRAVLLGLVAGHETTSRLTDAASYDTMTLHGWHTTGVYGAIGAAAAAVRVMGLDAAGTAHALGLAGSYVGGTWAFMADGAMSKRVHPGKSAETGLTAAVLARRGVTGPREVLDAAWGGLFETYVPGQADPQASLKDLGEGYRIMRKGVKPYPVCWGINSAADSMLKLRAAHGLTAANVRRVRVVLSEMSRRMIGRKRVDTVLDAQMSVAYALAWIILRGQLTLDEFTTEALRDPGARSLMARIDVAVDPAAHGERQTVEVETTDGRRLASRVEIPRGHWEAPLSDADLRDKFLALAGTALGSRAGAAADLVDEIESPGALPELLNLCVQSETGPLPPPTTGPARHARRSFTSAMLPFITRRVLSLAPLLLGMLVLGFAIIQLAPGDPVQLLVGDYPAPAEYVREVRERFGLDQPRWVQFARYAGQVLRGNLGYSFFYNEPVLDLLGGRLGATLLLMGAAFVISSAAGIGLGIACGRRTGSAVDHALMVVGLVGYSLPVFWLGQLLLMGLALKLDLFPTQGMRGTFFGLGPGGRALDVLHHLALPAITLATRYLALNVRLMRASLVETGAEDYLRTARAKGLSERVVIYKHALRNALLPVVTMMGLNVGHLVAGAVLTETVFAWPGLGRLIFDSILHRDYPVMLGGLLVVTVCVVVGNLLADLAYAVVDPRIRLERD